MILEAEDKDCMMESVCGRMVSGQFHMSPRGHLGNSGWVSPGFSSQEAIYELSKHSFKAVM